MKEKITTELNLFWNTQAQSQNNKRDLSLDLARGIAILLVVIGHSIFIPQTINIWISSFHLPAFFVISGWLLQEKQEENHPFKNIFIRKVRSILIPYLWFSLGSLLIDALQVFRGQFTKDILIGHTFETILLQGYSVMWFLPVLFFAELLVIALLKLAKRLPIHKLAGYLFLYVLLIGCAFSAYYGYTAYAEHVAYYGYPDYTSYAASFAVFDLSGLSLENLLVRESRVLVKIMIASLFIITGYLGGYLITGKEKNSDQKTTPRSGKLFVELAVGILLTSVNIICAFKVAIFDLNFLNLGMVWLYFLLGTTGSLGLLLICRNLPNIPLFTFYGQNSLIIMCTHLNFYVMYIGQLSAYFLAARLPGSDTLVIGFASVILTMFLEIFVILGIKIFFPFVLGKKRTSK